MVINVVLTTKVIQIFAFYVLCLRFCMLPTAFSTFFIPHFLELSILNCDPLFLNSYFRIEYFKFLSFNPRYSNNDFLNSNFLFRAGFFTFFIFVFQLYFRISVVVVRYNQISL